MKYKVGDIIEKMDGDIAKVYKVTEENYEIRESFYLVGCQGLYWALQEDEIKGLCVELSEPILSRFEILDL